jgi:hypothetical protein
MAFHTSQKLYSVNFWTGARVAVETEAHRAHVHRLKRVNEHMCIEYNCDLSAYAHDECLLGTKSAQR